MAAQIPGLDRADLLPRLAEHIVGRDNIHRSELEFLIDEYLPDIKTAIIDTKIAAALAGVDLIKLPDEHIKAELRSRLVKEIEQEVGSDLGFFERKEQERSQITTGARVFVSEASGYYSRYAGMVGVIFAATTDRCGVNFDNGNQEILDKSDVYLESSTQNERLVVDITSSSFGKFRQDLEERVADALDNPADMRAGKEYNWEHRPQVGDRIRMTPAADKIYGCTTAGSEGVITYISDSGPNVRFDKLTGQGTAAPHDFQVSLDYMVRISARPGEKRLPRFKDGWEEERLASDCFKVGDRIRMDEGANNLYGVTRAGSEGVIMGVERGDARVKFDKLTGGSDDSGTYTVSTAYMVRLKRISTEQIAEYAQKNRKKTAKIIDAALERVMPGIKDEYVLKLKSAFEAQAKDMLISELDFLTKADDETYNIDQKKLLFPLSKREYDSAIGQSWLRGQSEAYLKNQEISCGIAILIDTNRYRPEETLQARDSALALYHAVSLVPEKNEYVVVKFTDGGEMIEPDQLLLANLGGLYDNSISFRKAAAWLEQHDASSKLLYFITDGNPDGWGTTGCARQEQLLEQAAELSEMGISLEVVSISSLEKNSLDFLDKLAEQASGEARHLGNADGLPRLIIESYMAATRSKG